MDHAPAREIAVPIDRTSSTKYTKDMTNTKERRPQALQAILTRKNIEITCTLIFEDESASYPGVQSVSIRGAQREITGWLVEHGYAPAGRWSDEAVEDADGYFEWVRPFKPGPDADLRITGIWLVDPYQQNGEGAAT